MKRIKILVTVFLAGSILFAGCTKDNMDTLDTTAVTQNSNIAPFPTAMITYKLAATSAIQYLPIQWDNGNMAISELVFEGTTVNGGTLKSQQFQTSTNTTVNLFKPSVLGSIYLYLQPNSYNYGVFSLQLNPASSVKVFSPSSLKPPVDVAPSIPAAAFSLSGTFNANGTAIPVQLIISTQVILTSASINNITTSGSSIATLTLDLSGITNGITGNMLLNAQQTNGTIFITNSANENLYGMMLKNLQNNILQVQLPTVNPNTPDPVTPPNS